MKWQITGADRGTGEDRTIAVDADDETAARLKAKEHNLLVSSVAPSRVSDHQWAAAQLQQTNTTPEYAELYSTAGWSMTSTAISGVLDSTSMGATGLPSLRSTRVVAAVIRALTGAFSSKAIFARTSRRQRPVRLLRAILTGRFCPFLLKDR
jgi:hypothetical protein